MDISVRHATLADVDEMMHVDAAAFGIEYEPGEREEILTIVDPQRFLLATDDERVVGVAGDFPFSMTVPGGAMIDVPGVTWVSVSPTHRRRGILSELMRRQLGEYARAGAPAAVLTASESSIYGRFGYGAATRVCKIELDRRRAVPRRPASADGVVLATPQQARAAMPGIHERWRAQVPGAVSRSAAWWDLVVADRPSRRHGLTGLFYLLHPDGYVAYRVRDESEPWDGRNVCVIKEYATVTPEAHAALWQVLLGLDLFSTIESDLLPLDDALAYLITDPRQVRTTVIADGMWVRPLDVPTLLAARRYAVEVDLVLEVADDLFGDGRYRLRGGADGATCERVDTAADVHCDVSTLGALYLGGHRLQSMQRAGLVRVDDPGCASRLDRALLGDREPVHGTSF